MPTKLNTFISLREIPISLKQHIAMFKLSFVLSLCSVWLFSFLRQTSGLRLQRSYLDIEIMQIYFFLEQMRLFSLITLFLREISFLVFGIEILIIVLEKEAEAGGMALGKIELFVQISTVFSHVVEMKPWPIFIGEN